MNDTIKQIENAMESLDNRMRQKEFQNQRTLHAKMPNNQKYGRETVPGMTNSCYREV